MKRKFDSKTEGSSTEILAKIILKSSDSSESEKSESETNFLGLFFGKKKHSKPPALPPIYSNPEPPDSESESEDNKENIEKMDFIPKLPSPSTLVKQPIVFRQNPLFNLFSTDFKKPSRFNSNNLKQYFVDRTYTIHSLATLQLLFEEKLLNLEKPDFRFLVDIEGQAWFARETHLKYPAPAHYEMTGSSQYSALCRTGGNAWFSNDYKTLLKINNKSGDFRPNFDSLKWFFVILILNEHILPFKLPEILIVEELTGSRFTGTHQLKVSDIREWVKHIIIDETIRTELTNQPPTSKVVKYKEQLNPSCRFFDQNTDSKTLTIDLDRPSL